MNMIPHPRTLIAIVVAGASLVTTNIGYAQSSTITTKQQATARYTEDKKLCAEDTNSASRLQCLRQAKADYDQALIALKTSVTTMPKPTTTKAPAPIVCPDCARVTDIQVIDKQGDAGPLGVLAGGVAGALLGRQVGGGTGRDLATLAGAAGGAYAGHQVEQRVKSSQRWVVTAQYDNGDRSTFEFEADPRFSVGDLVRSSGNTLIRR